MFFFLCASFLWGINTSTIYNNRMLVWVISVGDNWFIARSREKRDDVFDFGGRERDCDFQFDLCWEDKYFFPLYIHVLVFVFICLFFIYYYFLMHIMSLLKIVEKREMSFSSKYKRQWSRPLNWIILGSISSNYPNTLE